MKTAIIVLVLVVVVFVATMVLVGAGVRIPGLEPPPTKSDGSVDEDALADWHPPSLASFMASAGGYFAPHADFGTTSLAVTFGTPRVVTAKPSDNDVDIAKVQVSGGALLISYACKHRKDGSSCSQTVCLCTPGSPLISPAVAFCGDDSQWKQAASPGVCSGRERQSGSILVYPEARNVSLTALGPAVSVDLK
ncbi:MAG TPA: hypothetical protein VMU08_14140 [Rhizomicrobium sp.]|nr:hypothetical protein [Rhizomicrobium sp.]